MNFHLLCPHSKRYLDTGFPDSFIIRDFVAGMDNNLCLDLAGNNDKAQNPLNSLSKKQGED